MVQVLAQATDAVAKNPELFGRSFLAAIALGMAAIGLGWVGSSYMLALGRNPEAGKAANQIIIIAAMIEVTALLAFLLSAFLLS